MKRKTVAIVGSADVMQDIAQEVGKLGVRVIKVWAIDFKRSKLDKKGISILQNLKKFDRIFFTSRNSAHFFMKEVKARNLAFPKRIKVTAIGPETAKAVLKEGLTVFLALKKSLTKDLSVKKGAKVLFPKSNLARKIPGTIPLVIYETVPKAIPKAFLKRIEGGMLDQLVFTSPSAVDSLMRQILNKAAVRKIEAISIGPTTAAALKDARFKKIRAAKSSDAKAVASLLRAGS